MSPTRPPADRSSGPRGLVTLRSVVETGLDVRFRLEPGDQPLVSTGERITAGSPVAAFLREPSIRRTGYPRGALGRGSLGRGSHAPGPEPGLRWSEPPGRVDVPERVGEHLFEVGGRWRLVVGEAAPPIESPLGGTVESVVPGMEIRLRSPARALHAAVVLGGPVRGRIQVVAAPGGEVRASAIDVGRAGEILVAGARIDAEALIRARAMGVRGVVVGGLSTKEQRDFLASEARQRAARQPLPAFAVVILDGPLRRPIASPVMAVLQALQGHDVAILRDPPALAFDVPEVELPVPDPAIVRILAGPLTGAEGRWAGEGGLRASPGGISLETGLVDLPDGRRIAVPLGDLEAYA